MNQSTQRIIRNKIGLLNLAEELANDPLSEFCRWKANFRILDVAEVKTVPYTPISHPIVERLIGTVRREYLDQTPFWGATDLERKLSAFEDYYNQHRTHQGIDGRTPFQDKERVAIPTADLHHFGWRSYRRGLFQPPVAV